MGIMIYIMYTILMALCLLSLHLIYSLRERRAFDWVGAGFLLVAGIHVIHNSLFRSTYVDNVLMFKIAPFEFLYGPLLYLVCIISDTKKISYWHLFHFVPFGLACLCYFIILFSAQKTFLNIFYDLHDYMVACSWLIYSIAIWVHMALYQDYTQYRSKGLYWIATAGGLSALTVLIIDVFDADDESKMLLTNLSNLVMFIPVLITIGFMYLYYFKLLFLKTSAKDKKPVDEEYLSYKSSSLNTIQMESYAIKITKYLSTEKYLDITFSLEILSRQTRIPKHHLSQVFTRYFKCNFTKHINMLRIDYACRILEQQDFAENVDNLVEKCGFKSKASFYRNFNLLRGCTPLEYRQSRIAYHPGLESNDRYIGKIELKTDS
ncbi:helix-turn-helix domain-containing protein [Sphingobacterium spiritivorum]|uniref:helix-turn-helix domain-containing protein n=1 Tax=Sphingobacterium spiritivorum TaxID=258 RepID=UPI003DA3787E